MAIRAIPFVGELPDPEFDPEGPGYDYNLAVDSGAEPDSTGHWPSINPRSGRVLKGRSHETWDKTEEGEIALGNTITKEADGYYYSKKAPAIKAVKVDAAPEPETIGKEQIGIIDRITKGLAAVTAIELARYRPVIGDRADDIPQMISDAVSGNLPEGAGALQKPVEEAISSWSKYMMTPEEEQQEAKRYPNLMAARYAAASLLLPGVSEKLASPTDLAEFQALSPEDQRNSLLGLTGGYMIGAAIGGAISGGAKLLSEKVPWMTKPMIEAVRESGWFGKLRGSRPVPREMALEIYDVARGIKGMKDVGLSDAEILNALKRSGNKGEFIKYKEQLIRENVEAYRKAKGEPIAGKEPPPSDEIIPEAYVKGTIEGTEPIPDKPPAGFENLVRAAEGRELALRVEQRRGTVEGEPYETGAIRLPEKTGEVSIQPRQKNLTITPKPVPEMPQRRTTVEGEPYTTDPLVKPRPKNNISRIRPTPKPGPRLPQRRITVEDSPYVTQLGRLARPGVQAPEETLADLMGIVREKGIAGLSEAQKRRFAAMPVGAGGDVTAATAPQISEEVINAPPQVVFHKYMDLSAIGEGNVPTYNVIGGGPDVHGTTVTAARLKELGLEVPEPPSEAGPETDVTTKTGKPFLREGNLRRALEREGKTETHVVTKVPGGYVGKTMLSAGYVGDVQNRAIDRIPLQQKRRLLKLLVEIPKWFEEAGADPELMSRIDVELKSIIEVPKEGAEESIEQHAKLGRTIDRILGSTTFDPTGMFATIKLSLDQGTASLKRASIHEIYHPMKDWMVPRAESERMSKFFSYNEEAEANDFADFIIRRGEEGQKKRPDWLTKIYRAIRNLLERIYHFLSFPKVKDPITGEYSRKSRGFTARADIDAIWEGLKQGVWKTRPITSSARTTVSFTGEENPVQWSYSQLAKVAADPAMPTKAQSIPNWLEKQGVKPAEMKWYGVDQWIAENQTPQGKIDRQAFSDWVNANKVEIHEIVKTEEGVVSEEDAYEIAEEIYVAIDKLNPDLEFLVDEGVLSAEWISELTDATAKSIVSNGSSLTAMENLSRDIKAEARELLNGKFHRMTTNWDMTAEELARFEKALGEVAILRQPRPQTLPDAVLRPYQKLYERGVEILKREYPWIQQLKDAGIVAPPEIHSQYVEMLSNGEDIAEVMDYLLSDYYNQAISEAIRLEPDRLVEDNTDIIREIYGIDLPEEVPRDPTPFRGLSSGVDEAKIARYGADSSHNVVLPGGEQYTEMLFTLPVRASIVSRAEIGNIESSGKNYQSPHWEEINVLAHTRFNSRTDAEGNSVLFVEEIQSDWLQEAKKQGFIEPISELPDGWEVKKIEPSRILGGEVMWEVQRLNDNGTISVAAKRDTREGAIAEALRQIGSINESSREDRVPKAPLVDTWHEYVAKRLLRWAAEKGYDRVAWTTGKQQIDRAQYALRQNVDQITWENQSADNLDVVKLGDNRYAVFNKRTKQFVSGQEHPNEGAAWETVQEIQAQNELNGGSVVVTAHKGGKVVFSEALPMKGSTVVHTREVTLEGLVGAEIAKKIRSGESRGSIEGDDLSIGGEGMKTFYDQRLPGFLSKYGKQWGAKVGKTTIGTVYKPVLEIRNKDGKLIDSGTEDDYDVEGIMKWAESKGYTTEWVSKSSISDNVHYIDVTESMRNSVLHKGQTMFSVDPQIKTGRADKVKARVEALKKEYTTPVPGSPLDKGAMAYLNEPNPMNLQVYLDNMPSIGDLSPKEIYRFDEKANKYIASLTTEKGNVKPAIRQSGYFVLKDFMNQIESYTDISKRVEMWTDPTRMIQAIDQGRFGGPVQQHVLWPARSTVLAKLKWVDHMKKRVADIVDEYNINSKKKDEAVTAVLELISTGKAYAEDIAGIKRLKGLPDALARIRPKDQDSIIKAAIEMRKWFSSARSSMNKARKLRKQTAIPYREFYAPDIIAQSAWSKTVGYIKGKGVIVEHPEMPDFVKPDQPFNPRALHKAGAIPDKLKERKISALAADYADTAGRDIFDTNIIHNNKIYSAALKSAGLENAAAAIDTWTSEVFAGTVPAVSKVANKVLPQPVKTGMLALRRNLARAVFPLNFTWNVFIQTSSAGITLARYGTVNSLYGLSYLLDPTMNQAVKQIAYSSILKSRWGGKMHFQDVQESITRNKRLQGSKIDSALEYANFLTSAVEDALTGHAVAAAYRHGQKLGLTGRALWEYASEGGAKTQSMYNYSDLPGLLRAREIGALVPFQTFAFEVFNTVREINIPIARSIVGKVGTYETTTAGKVDPESDEGKATIRRRLGMLARWVAALMVTNAVVDKAIGRKPWGVSSFIPFVGFLFGDLPKIGDTIGGSYSGKGPTPHEYFADLIKGIDQLIKYEDFTRLRTWVLRYHAAAGTQWDRTIQGIEAVARGEVRDVEGKRLFKVKEPSEQVRAIVMGPYRTEAGVEYLREKKEKKGGKVSKRGARQIIKGR